MANGLINLQTDLKSLRYGNDKPYITKNIGQAPGSQIGLEVQARIDDTSRIAQMLIDKPGIKYLLNEAQLQQVGVGQRIKKAQQEGKSVAGAVLGQLGNTLVGTAKILGSTLAQVPVNGTGLHFLKGFRTDTYLQPTNGNQASGFAQFFGAGGVEGAQYALRGEEVPGVHESELLGRSSKYDYDDYLNSPIPADSEGHKALAEAGKPITLPGPQYETTAQPFELGRSNKITEADQGELLPNNGNNGKKRVYTAGNTYTETDTATNIGTVLNPTPTAGVGVPGRIYIGGKDVSGVSTDKQLKEDSDLAFFKYADQRGIKDLSSFPSPIDIGELYTVSSSQEIAKVPDGSIQDFRQKFKDTYSFDYDSLSIRRETRVNLGDQGKKKSSTFYTKYNTRDELAIDKINNLPELDQKASSKDERDFAKFYFEIITPDGSKFLHFRAFIDSIDDSYGADWQGTRYVGRAENFYTYGGFERDINISFKIAAATRSEMKPLYRKMVYLASSTAPTYGGQGFMRGSLARITIGSYFSQLPGVITSVKYNLIDGMPWEIAFQNPEAEIDDDVQELPMGLQCSVSFKVIHDFAPQTGLQHYFTNPKPANGSQPFF
jgi:hypothetical protein